jgi:hypothetical protein
MSSFKKLNRADVTTVPYAANKRWSFSYSLTPPNDSYVIFYEGKNTTFNSSQDYLTTNNIYASSIYDQINHLFYQSFSGSLLNTGSLLFNINTYESASQYRPSASYFNYNTNPLMVKDFPSGSNTIIEVYNINQNIYGSKILPTSFQISSSVNNIVIKDDGNGNLYETQTNTFIGNIFYAHGIIVNTGQAYSLLYENATISFQNEHIIYENEVKCTINESEFSLSYNPSLVTGSYTSGSLRGFATSASFTPYVTTIGLYNDDNDLLMVAKLSKPIVISADTDMTFIVKYDT